MYPLLTLQCAALFAEAVVIYIVTFSVTIIFLLRRRRSSKTHGLLVIVTIVMFLLSTACMGLLASSVLRHVHSGIIGDGLALRDPAYPEPYLQIIIECLNCILELLINYDLQLAVAVTLITRTAGLNVMLDLLAQFTGLYPTLIVFFVAVWKSHQGSTVGAGRSFFLTQAGDSDERTRHSAMVFAPGVTAATSFTNSELIAGHDEVTIKISV
ncbi:hypothetical protein BDY19DRAFT_1055514 [Irpex rosettiformis]|uniref:Uncharacterized protein n=1 Tax=Irpex rosettiformis TaxID=378272 RepID=A0ACB8U8K4_9APHY|nr:hypothetical protein BDY19DRAFT_1055514 [Irpex rosettiformis]